MAVVFSNIINIFAAPTEVFQNIKITPKWLITFIIIAIVSIVCGYLLLPFMQKILEQTLSAKMDEEQAQQALSTMKIFQILGLLLAVVPLLIKWLFVASLMYFGAILFNAQQINYKSVFSVVVLSELILLLMGIINLLVLYIKGAESVNTITDLNTIIGLDYFLADRSHNIPLYTVLSSFNIFSVWYAAVLTIGISIVAGISKAEVGNSIIIGMVYSSRHTSGIINVFFEYAEHDGELNIATFSRFFS